jgi:RNA polymerase sigma-70 factor (ECF subfamily)
MVATLTAIADRAPTADELCRLYAADVCRFAALMSRSPADAEDLAQEALLKAVRGLPGFDPSRGSVSGWLWRIVANAARDAAGRRRRWSDLVIRAGIMTPRESQSVEDVALARIRDGELRRMLATLPLRDRTLVALRYGAGLDAGEVGRVMGMQSEAAGKAIRRALARLRARMEETPR